MVDAEKQIAPDMDKFVWYLAGVIDGEGSFLVNLIKNKNGFSPVLRIKLSSPNKEALLQIQERLNSGRIYQNNAQKSENDLKPFGWYLSSFKEIERVVALIDGKLLIKRGEFEVFKRIMALIGKKREEKGISGQGFAREELLQILELRDQMHLDRQRDKRYKNKEWYLENYFQEG